MSPSNEKAIDLQMVRHLASLSRLRLTAGEEQRLVKEMQDIVSYFATIDRAKVEGLEPSVYAVETPGRTREDRPEPGNSDGILTMVPNKKGRYVKAPRVF